MIGFSQNWPGELATWISKANKVTQSLDTYKSDFREDVWMNAVIGNVADAAAFFARANEHLLLP